MTLAIDPLRPPIACSRSLAGFSIGPLKRKSSTSRRSASSRRRRRFRAIACWTTPRSRSSGTRRKDRLALRPGRAASMLTGARRTEVAEARWSEFDLAAKTWTLPKERAKNKVAHLIPLSDMAIEILEKLPRIANKDDFVFTFGRVPVGVLRAKRSSSMLRSRLTLARRSLAGHFTTFVGWSRRICSDLACVSK